jgi:hypothetical protein
MTFPEDENQLRPMSLSDAIRWLTGDFETEEKPLTKAPEPPIPTKIQKSIDPNLWSEPRKGAEEAQMRSWWEEHGSKLVYETGWKMPTDQSYDYGVGRWPNYDIFPYQFPPIPRGGIRYGTTTTTTSANTPKKEPVTTKREEILDEASKLITQDRQEQYGPPEENFKNIADVWNVRFKNKLTEPFTPADVAAAMALLKIVRDMAGYKEDSAIDAAAYIALYAELSEKESKA